MNFTFKILGLSIAIFLIGPQLNAKTCSETTVYESVYANEDYYYVSGYSQDAKIHVDRSEYKRVGSFEECEDKHHETEPNPIELAQANELDGIEASDRAADRRYSAPEFQARLRGSQEKQRLTAENVLRQRIYSESELIDSASLARSLDSFFESSACSVIDIADKNSVKIIDKKNVNSLLQKGGLDLQPEYSSWRNSQNSLDLFFGADFGLSIHANVSESFNNFYEYLANNVYDRSFNNRGIFKKEREEYYFLVMNKVVKDRTRADGTSAWIIDLNDDRSVSRVKVELHLTIKKRFSEKHDVYKVNVQCNKG